MTGNPLPSYPGGSKSRVNRAGDGVRSGHPSADDLLVIDVWRAAHRAVLNTFQAILRGRTRGTEIYVAQRLKRKNTIFDKLERLPNMQLSRMDDIAGCRLIFKNIRDLSVFRKEFHSAKFSHKRKNDVSKYNYIEHPKDTGYRGIHDIYEYDVNSEVGKPLAGLYIEIQYRTVVQHAWATAVEVVGFITESQPKFQKGDTRYQEAMAYASEILARGYEKSAGPFPKLSDREVVKRFLALDRQLGLMNTLRGLNVADEAVTENKNSILIFSPEGRLEVKSYRDATEAVISLFELEKTYPGYDIVLVRADTSDEVRFAFKNYFSDAKQFIKYVETGCQRLSGASSVVRRSRQK